MSLADAEELQTLEAPVHAREQQVTIGRRPEAVQEPEEDLLVHVSSPASPAACPLSRSHVATATTRSLGEVVATYGNTGFALVRLDRLEPQPGRVTAGDISVALVRPAWLA